ncbi:MAG: DUF2934 domain-containing protein [Opitutaceae bacterium]|nr:DUF2934 domain-containing protein [Opitutaceae bacterium]
MARRARELWEQDGCPEGFAEKHWLEAERQLHASSLPQAQAGAPHPAVHGWLR